MPYRKYTKEILEPIVKESISIQEVVKRLGKAQAGGTHSNIKKRIKEFEIDISHFLGQKANSGKNHKGGYKKRQANEILILRKENSYREKHYLLTRALLEISRKYKCYICWIYEWQGKKLVLQIEHKNGNPTDDRAENLEFICPNCHSQTDTYCRNRNTSLA